MNEFLELMDEREFVQGRAARLNYKAELARGTGQRKAVREALAELEDTGLRSYHRAAMVFPDGRPGIVLRIRRPAIVLIVEAASSLWIQDRWVRHSSNRGRS